ncbi:MAG: hypothetical protein ACC652_12295 [Acidimicrobiales bacterium]
MNKRTLFLGPYHTTTGDIRVPVEIADEKLSDLRGELRANALVAEDLTEFKSLAMRSIRSHGGMFGEFRSTRVPQRPLKSWIKLAAEQSDVLIATQILLDGIGFASDQERHDFVSADDFSNERAYVASLLHDLDELGAELTAGLCTLLNMSPDDLRTLG